MAEQISNSDCNPILVLLLPFFLSIIGTFISCQMIMKAPQRVLPSIVYSFIPILGWVVIIDNFLVAKKLANGETIDALHHEIGFLNGLPLMS